MKKSEPIGGVGGQRKKEGRHRGGREARLLHSRKEKAEGGGCVWWVRGGKHAFDADRFHPISLPTVVEKALLAASHS